MHVGHAATFFEEILDYVRDGSCVLPKGYTPNTYDSRPATTEAEDLYAMLKEVAFYSMWQIASI